MSQVINQKKCSGCKTTKPHDQFYKNKLILDGHSNYCIECTRENSKRYHQRKKEKTAKLENDQIVKQVFLQGLGNKIDDENAENLMKIMMIEKLCKTILDELSELKKNLVKEEEVR